MIDDQVPDPGQARLQSENDSRRQLLHVSLAHEPVGAIDVAGAGSADAFAARARQRNRLVDRFQPDQHVQHHAIVPIDVNLEALHIGPDILVRVVATNFDDTFGDHEKLQFVVLAAGRRCGPRSANMVRPRRSEIASAAAAARLACYHAMQLREPLVHRRLEQWVWLTVHVE